MVLVNPANYIFLGWLDSSVSWVACEIGYCLPNWVYDPTECVYLMVGGSQFSTPLK